MAIMTPAPAPAVLANGSEGRVLTFAPRKFLILFQPQFSFVYFRLIVKRNWFVREQVSHAPHCLLQIFMSRMYVQGR